SHVCVVIRRGRIADDQALAARLHRAIAGFTLQRRFGQILQPDYQGHPVEVGGEKAEAHGRFGGLSRFEVIQNSVRARTCQFSVISHAISHCSFLSCSSSLAAPRKCRKRRAISANPSWSSLRSSTRRSSSTFATPRRTISWDARFTKSPARFCSVPPPTP